MAIVQEALEALGRSISLEAKRRGETTFQGVLLIEWETDLSNYSRGDQAAGEAGGSFCCRKTPSVSTVRIGVGTQ